MRTQQKFIILGISVSLEEAVGAWEVWGGSLMLALQVLRVTHVPKCSKDPRPRCFWGVVLFQDVSPYAWGCLKERGPGVKPDEIHRHHL